tara:strand:- start:38 stop:280 length:243 start_codon:yes stop_codon:yes gene_type:complete
MSEILINAINHKYKDDPIRSQWIVRGPNWHDVEIVEDDGDGNAKRSATQLSKAEVETAIEEWIVAKADDPTLGEPPKEGE